MNNEIIKKLGSYCHQVEQFALGMEDEMNVLQLPEWVIIAKKIMGIASEMGTLKNQCLAQKEVA